MMRIILFGDGRWATNSMSRLINEGREIVGIVARNTPSENEFIESALKLRVPISQPKTVNSPRSIRWISDLKPDLCLSIAYNQILKQPVIGIPDKGFINFHAGKLPNYRGRNVINWAIINGEAEIGITAHYIDEGIDTGDIILQYCLPIGWSDTYGDVISKVVEFIPDLVSETVARAESGQVQRTPQSHLLGTYFGGRGQSDEWINWNDTSVNLHNKIRAITDPGPGATTSIGGNKIIVWRAHYETTWPRYIATPGQIVGQYPGRGVIAKTGDSTLLILSVQSEGNSPIVPVWPIGTRLEMNIS